MVISSLLNRFKALSLLALEILAEHSNILPFQISGKTRGCHREGIKVLFLYIMDCRQPVAGSIDVLATLHLFCFQPQSGVYTMTPSYAQREAGSF